MESIKTTLKRYKDEIAIFVVAFIIRLIYFLILKTKYVFYHNPSSDVTYYIDWAEQILAGPWIGNQTFYGLPLYPYFLSFIKAISFNVSFIVVFYHLVLGAAICTLTYMIAKNVFDRKIALTAGIITSINYSLVYYSSMLMPVTLITLLSLLIIWILIDDKKYLFHERIFFGIIIGITILGDGKLLFFTAGIILLQFFTRHKKLFKWWLPVMFGIVIILGLTTVRNKVVGGSWVFISAQSGLTNYIGNGPNATGYFENPEFIRPTHQGQDQDVKIAAEHLSGTRLTDREVVTFWNAKTREHITSHPEATIRLILKKIRLFMTQSEYAYDLDLIFQRDWKQRLDVNPFSLLFPLAFVGMFFSSPWKRKRLYLISMILSQALVCLIYFLTHRHRATIYPILIIFEAAGILHLIHLLRQKRFELLILSAIFILSFLIIFSPISMPSNQVDFLMHSKKGAIYNLRNNSTMAKKHLHQAYILQPNDTNVLYNLGNAYYNDMQLPQAAQYYQQAIDLQPLNVDVWYNLAYTLEEQGKIELSIQAYNQVLELQPSAVDAMYRSAHLYQLKNDCQKALRLTQMIKKQYPAISQMIDQEFLPCHHHLNLKP